MSRVETYEMCPEGLAALAAAASLEDASSRLPAGAYTTLRTYGGRRVLRLSEHVARLEESVAAQGRAFSLSPAAVRRALAEALDATGHAESRVRLTFSPPRVFVSVEAFAPLPERLYEEGVACVTVPLSRTNPHAKDTRFIATAAAAYRRLPPGALEGLLVAEDGSLLEGLSSNFFAVLDDVLRTEDARALRGVTRQIVLDVAHGLMPVRTRAVRTGDLDRLSEAFVTSVSREILPVVRVDGRAVGDGRPGPRTREIRRAFVELIEREAEAA